MNDKLIAGCGYSQLCQNDSSHPKMHDKSKVDTLDINPNYEPTYVVDLFSKSSTKSIANKYNHIYEEIFFYNKIEKESSEMLDIFFENIQFLLKKDGKFYNNLSFLIPEDEEKANKDCVTKRFEKIVSLYKKYNFNVTAFLDEQRDQVLKGIAQLMDLPIQSKKRTPQSFIDRGAMEYRFLRYFSSFPKFAKIKRPEEQIIITNNSREELIKSTPKERFSEQIYIEHAMFVILQKK